MHAVSSSLWPDCSMYKTDTLWTEEFCIQQPYNTELTSHHCSRFINCHCFLQATENWTVPSSLRTHIVAPHDGMAIRLCTDNIGCQCLRGHSSKLLHWILTVSKAPGLPTSAALSAQLLTILAVLVSARPSMVICSFHEPEQLGSVDGAFSSQLQLSGTHCRITFTPRPSVAVSFEQGSRLIFSGWPFTDISSENYWTDWTELNWTELNCCCCCCCCYWGHWSI